MGPTSLFEFHCDTGIQLLSIDPAEIVRMKSKYTIIVIWNLIRGLTLKGLLSGMSTRNICC